MATRFYLPQSGAAPASPAYTSSWESVANAARMPLVTEATNTALTSRSTDKAAATEPYDSLAGQWVSEALPAGDVSGTFTLVTGATEPTGSRDAFLQCVIRVVSGDGSTVRGTLYAGQTATVESAVTTASNYEFALFSFKVRVLTATLTSVTAQAGDRIVVEYGSRACNANTYTNSVQVIIGDSTSASDLPATVDANGSTGDGRPWIEFSQDVFAGAPADATVTLAATMRRKTASFSLQGVAGVALGASLRPKTAAFQLASVADLALNATLRRKTAAFDMAGVADERTVTLAATLRPKTAAFALGSTAEVELAASLRRKTATFALDAAAQLGLAATLRPKTAAFVLNADQSDVPITADTTNRVNGRNRSGLALVRFEPAVVLPPSPEPEHERHVGAVAFSTPVIVGAQPVYTVSAATKRRTRHRILVGGKDVSFYRDVATPEPGYGLAEPLLWDRCTIDFPQIAAAFENPGKDALRWCRKGAPVVLQRVTAAGEVVSIDYRGVVIGHDIAGKTLKVECGGHASGRAALRYKPLPIFKDTLDLGRLAWAAIRDLGLRFEPRLGPTTGMKQALWGGMWHGEYIDELSGRAQQRDGTQWTIMPSDAGVYRMQPKDRETIDFTVFTDDKRAVPNLRSDASEEPNRIFASGVTPRGQRVRFGVYPGLKPSKPAPYPFLDDRAFGFGTTDEDTDTGDGITVMVRTLWGMGYLSLEDADPDGGFDADVRGAVEALQDDAGIHDGPLGYLDKGAMDPETWAALFDLDVTSFNIRGARIEPAAQAPRTRRYRRSASGRIMGKNPRFDRHALIVDRPLEFGFGYTRHQMREWSAAEIARGEDNWVGTLDITTGGVLHGEVAPGTVIGGDDIMDVRAIQPGMNAWLPTFAGGILVHVSAVEISYDGNGIPQAKLYVDTQARDAMQVWDVIRRNRESREDPARRRKGNRASTELKDSITEWDEVGGVVYDDVDLQPGWNVIPVVAGQEGSVSRIRVLIQDLAGGDGEIAIQGREFAVAVFGKKVTPARLRHLIGNPLAASPDSSAEPGDVDPPETDPETDGADPAPSATANRPWWERKAIADALRNLELLHSAGTREEPCGYSPGRKSNGGTKTGLYRRDAEFNYRTHGEPVLYLAVWVWGERTMSAGRVMWNQLEPGA